MGGNLPVKTDMRSTLVSLRITILGSVTNALVRCHQCDALTPINLSITPVLHEKNNLRQKALEFMQKKRGISPCFDGAEY